MMKFRSNKGCRNGGRPPLCQARECCQEKGLAGCWECDSHVTCEKLDFLAANHGDAHRKNLTVLHKRWGQGFLKGRRYW